MEKMPTKKRILESALTLFSEKGYDGVGVDLIAEQAGIKGPSLYRHFKGKEDILNTLIANVEEHYSAHFGDAGEPGVLPNSLEELISISMEQLQFTMHDPVVKKVRKILAMEQFRNPMLAEIATNYSMTDIQEMYTHYFEHLISIGALKKENPEILAFEYIAPITLLLQVCDRQPEKEAVMKEQMRVHFEHFVSIYR